MNKKQQRKQMKKTKQKQQEQADLQHKQEQEFKQLKQEFVSNKDLERLIFPIEKRKLSSISIDEILRRC